MNIAEAISSLDLLEGRVLTIEGFLHSDTMDVWLSDQHRSTNKQVTIRDPRIANLLLSNFPPTLGGIFAYCLQAVIQGTIRYDTQHQLILLDAIDSLVVNWREKQQRLI
jgi:hypothetical protein